MERFRFIVNEKEFKFVIGDLVKRKTDNINGSGVLYRVVDMKMKASGYKRELLPQCKIKRALAFFQTLDSKRSNDVWEKQSRLCKVDIVELGMAYNELNLLIQSEVRRMSE